MMVHRTPTCHAFSPVKVAILSGLSDPATCALTAVQQRFLDALDVPADWKVRLNFPYVPSCSTPRPAPPLWRASMQNLRQFLIAGRVEYRQAAHRHWESLRRSCEHVVIVALSCGYEIIRQCLRIPATLAPSHVIALGPVGWQSATFSCTFVQGSRDYLSKCFFRAADIVLPGLGHIGYLEHPRVIQLTNELLCGSTLQSPAPGCTSRSNG